MAAHYVCEMDGVILDWPGASRPRGWEYLPGYGWTCPGCTALIDRLMMGAGSNGGTNDGRPGVAAQQG